MAGKRVTRMHDVELDPTPSNPTAGIERLSPSDLRLFNHLNARAQVLQAGMTEIQAAVNVLLAPHALQQGDQIRDDGTIARAPKNPMEVPSEEVSRT